MSNQIFTNNATSITSNTLGATDLVIPVVDSSSFPTITGTDYTLVTVQSGTLIEIIKLTAPGVTGNTLIVDPSGRGWEGTTALIFAAGAIVEMRVTAGSLNTIVNNAATAESNEISRAEGIETGLQTNITAEALLRSNADTSEAITRGDADTTLQTNIDTEASTRDTADGTLQTNIDTEVSRAEIAEALLAPLVSPTFTGLPQVPTVSYPDNTNSPASTKYVTTAISSALTASPPEIINMMASGTVYNRSHIGQVMITFNFSALVIGVVTYEADVNGSAIYNVSIPDYVSQQIYAQSFAYEITGTGAFNVSMAWSGTTPYSAQIIIQMY